MGYQNLTRIAQLVKDTMRQSWADGVVYYNDLWDPINDPNWVSPIDGLPYSRVPAGVDWISYDVSRRPRFVTTCREAEAGLLRASFTHNTSGQPRCEHHQNLYTKMQPHICAGRPGAFARPAGREAAPCAGMSPATPSAAPTRRALTDFNGGHSGAGPHEELLNLTVTLSQHGIRDRSGAHACRRPQCWNLSQYDDFGAHTHTLSVAWPRRQLAKRRVNVATRGSTTPVRNDAFSICCAFRLADLKASPTPAVSDPESPPLCFDVERLADGPARQAATRPQPPRYQGLKDRRRSSRPQPSVEGR